MDLLSCSGRSVQWHCCSDSDRSGPYRPGTPWWHAHPSWLSWAIQLYSSLLVASTIYCKAEWARHRIYWNMGCGIPTLFNRKGEQSSKKEVRCIKSKLCHHIRLRVAKLRPGHYRGEQPGLSNKKQRTHNKHRDQSGMLKPAWSWPIWPYGSDDCVLQEGSDEGYWRCWTYWDRQDGNHTKWLESEIYQNIHFVVQRVKNRHDRISDFWYWSIQKPRFERAQSDW